MTRIVPTMLLLAAGTGLLVAGCGEDDPAQPTVFVHVTPTHHTLAVGETVLFEAVVLGTANLEVSWTVIGGASYGTIDRTGLYTAPNSLPDPPAATVRATSRADTTKTAESTVTLLVPQAIEVAVAPDSITVHAGHAHQFRSTVTGTAAEEVTWSVDEGPEYGTIDTRGLYTAPDIVPGPPLATVRAASVADPSKSGTAVAAIYKIGPTPPGYVRIPAGSFTMGDGIAPCGSNLYPVTLTKDFYLGRAEVTNAQYLDMLQWAYDNGHVAATLAYVYDAMGSNKILVTVVNSEIAFRNGTFRLADNGHGINPDHPVTMVSWYGAAAYCDWLSLREGLDPAYDHTTWRCNDRDPYRAWGYRLPTDAEWEYAAQYDDERRYPWGDVDLTSSLANYNQNVGWTAPVGSYQAEKTIDGNGLFDMAGNVREWCNDWFECFAFPASTDPPGPPTGIDRVYRGGGWQDSGPSLRCAARMRTDPGRCSNDLGFRVARTVIP
jgi:formylglycine-generating enzyme required for sulfatase activity